MKARMVRREERREQMKAEGRMTHGEAAEDGSGGSGEEDGQQGEDDDALLNHPQEGGKRSAEGQDAGEVFDTKAQRLE